MSWDNWLGTNLTYKEEIVKRGVLLTTPVVIDTSCARNALDHSAPRFLAYCAFARFARQNRSLLSRRSFLFVLRYPNHWDPEEFVSTAKLILKKNGEIVVNHHPPKGKHGHEINADDLLRYARIILFASEATDLHPDIEVACTHQVQLDVNQGNHFEALAKLLDCGVLDDDDVAALKAIPSARFNSIFRVSQSASVAISKISKADPKKPTEIEISVNVEKGFGEASRWARNLKQDLAEWRAGRLSWSEIDKGILIFGPSGTGKTMFAKALAKSLDISLVATSVTRWQASKDGHLGDLLKAMYSTFDEARQSAPCLIFLDELDSIGHRGRLPSRWENYTMQVINALLECLDGATGREGVIVISACNFPDRIDPALLRSGRLEKHVHFPFPDANARLEILEGYLPHLAGNDRLRTVAERLPGKTGADINQMVRESRRLARKGARKVTISDIEYLMPTVQILTNEELFRVSVHESGHAIVAATLGIGEVLSVEVFDCDTHHPTETHAHGLTSIAHGNRLITPRSKMLADIATLLAGIVAEEIILGERSNSAGGSQTSDLDRATLLAMEFLVVHGLGETLTTSYDAIDRHGMSELWKNQPLREAANRLLQSEFRRVKSLLSGRERDLRLMADALVEAKKLSGNELDCFLQNKDKAVRKSRTG